MNTESILKSNPSKTTQTLNTRPIFNRKTHQKRGIVREQTVIKRLISGLEFLPQAIKKLQSKTMKYVRYLFG
jgi:hypothetical protein